ncbi:a g-specific adenine glycosylase [Lasius niger]|uniref:Adenine DNA glycosylase n=1 Tax=Lasius niger TaxID=67767 RepID=A0A0J7NQ31_LASNI|nr:a g-specific adenine glycosylase [Lasius niger]
MLDSSISFIPDAHLLLKWYDQNGRTLPWRAEKSAKTDPYHVWLSEIMLQQTGVKTVIDYYHKFLTKWPTIQAFAQASEEEVMKEWAGLGYYARARNLLKCAHQLIEIGGFPSTPAELRKLPGIGPYTANAIASMAFNQPYVAVDGNVERVAARIFAFLEPLPAARPALHKLSETLNHSPAAQNRPSDFMQALFDLGSLICTPRSPACLSCPWINHCQAFKNNQAAELPKRAPKAKNPTKYGAVFILENEAGEIWLQKRPPKGLLGSTMEMPGTSWELERQDEKEILSRAPIQGKWQKAEEVKHVFTHFTLFLMPYFLPSSSQKFSAERGRWANPAEAALSTLMKKAYQNFLAQKSTPQQKD